MGAWACGGVVGSRLELVQVVGVEAMGDCKVEDGRRDEAAVKGCCHLNSRGRSVTIRWGECRV